VVRPKEAPEKISPARRAASSRVKEKMSMYILLEYTGVSQMRTMAIGMAQRANRYHESKRSFRMRMMAIGRQEREKK